MRDDAAPNADATVDRARYAPIIALPVVKSSEATAAVVPGHVSIRQVFEDHRQQQRNHSQGDEIIYRFPGDDRPGNQGCDEISYSSQRGADYEGHEEEKPQPQYQSEG